MNHDSPPHSSPETQKPPRIQFQTNAIDIKRLEHETNKVLALGVLVSILFHATLFMAITYKRTEVRVLKPIQVELMFENHA